MRIAQISTTAGLVRENSSSRIEAQVWLLTRELTRRGHEVTTFCVKGSSSDGEWVETLPGPCENAFDDWHLCEWTNLCEAVKQSKRFDILHSHAYLWGLPLDPLSDSPMVHTMHVMPEEDSARLWRQFPNARVTALSHQQYGAYPDLRPVTVIPHCVDVDLFTLQTTPGDYVCYLGTFETGTGPELAIAAAQATGIRLVLAGPSTPYFREAIQPMVDGVLIQYAGVVTREGRDKLLRNARALIYPTQCAMAFDLVMVEGMCFGTPVVAFQCGAVPEIIENGISGYYTNSIGDLANALGKALALDRVRVRQYAEAKFSSSRVASCYEQVYKAVSGSQGLA